VSEWTSEELEKIAAAEELQLASVRRDGTLGKPVTISVGRHGEDLYVRSRHGRTSTWIRGAQDRHEGHIRAGGVGKDVTTPQARDATSLVPRPDRLPVRKTTTRQGETVRARRTRESRGA
jgi:hypothetical protein